MAHYFDDVFGRHIGQPESFKPRPMRRSSTSRSIGNRSEFNVSINGDGHNDDDGQSLRNSVDPEGEREREEANKHVANYVSEQLEKVLADDAFEPEDI
jgi:hypothetical protein